MVVKTPFSLALAMRACRRGILWEVSDAYQGAGIVYKFYPDGVEIIGFHRYTSPGFYLVSILPRISFIDPRLDTSTRRVTPARPVIDFVLQALCRTPFGSTFLIFRSFKYKISDFLN